MSASSPNASERASNRRIPCGLGSDLMQWVPGPRPAIIASPQPHPRRIDTAPNLKESKVKPPTKEEKMAIPNSPKSRKETRHICNIPPSFSPRLVTEPNSLTKPINYCSPTYKNARKTHTTCMTISWIRPKLGNDCPSSLRRESPLISFGCPR